MTRDKIAEHRAKNPRCSICGHGPDDLITDCEHKPGETHGPIIDGKCKPCSDGEKALRDDGTININARYYLTPIVASMQWPELVQEDAIVDVVKESCGNFTPKIFNVIDRAKELRFDPAPCIFSNGTEAECREWIERNCDEPPEHSPGPFWTQTLLDARNGRIEVIAQDGTIITDLALSIAGDEPHNREQRANAALFKAAPQLLALLEQYHAAMPTKESGALIAEARGWM